jgi:hypothetical protein
MTATERYYYAAMRYGDNLFDNGNYCEAYEQYKDAQAIGNLDGVASKHANQAYQQCFPPTEIPADTKIAPTEPPPDTAPAPTEVPTEAPTEPPATEAPTP